MLFVTFIKKVYFKLKNTGLLNSQAARWRRDFLFKRVHHGCVITPVAFKCHRAQYLGSLVRSIVIIIACTEPNKKQKTRKCTHHEWSLPTFWFAPGDLFNFPLNNRQKERAVLGLPCSRRQGALPLSCAWKVRSAEQSG